MVRAAFLAGYMVGRNPDLLFLAADDSGDGDE
jgi:K+-transporting ATPase A subunit